VYGLFAIGTMWMFYLTFDKIWLYVISTLTFDFSIAFIGLKFLEELGIMTLMNHGEGLYCFIIFVVGLMMYGFQRWIEKDVNAR